MWTKAQGQAVGRIVGEYRDNPANAKKRLSTEVEEGASGFIYLIVKCGKTVDERMILQDGTIKTEF